MGPKQPICPEQHFFGKTINIAFIYLLVFFIVQNFLKILRVDPELRVCSIFGPKTVRFPKTRTFFEKIINIICIPIVPFHCAISTLLRVDMQL